MTSASPLNSRNDFDGNGTSDILWQNDGGTPAVWLMNGTGSRDRSGVSPIPGRHGTRRMPAISMRTGRPTFSGRTITARSAVWLMNGVDVLARHRRCKPGASWHANKAADFNGDGKADILWQNDNGTPAVWLMDGVNVLRRAPRSPIPASLGTRRRRPISTATARPTFFGRTTTARRRSG